MYLPDNFPKPKRTQAEIKTHNEISIVNGTEQKNIEREQECCLLCDVEEDLTLDHSGRIPALDRLRKARKPPLLFLSLL